jgi:glycosyltransferase involved in cell wall biosynthesis
LVQTIEERRLGNVRFVGRQPREKVPMWLAASDACVVPLVNTPVFKTAIPSKMFEAMAAGRPIVLGVEGEAREILLDAEAGIAIPPEDVAAMVAAFERLAQSPAAARQMGLNGRRAAITLYSRREQAARYVDILEDVKEQFYGRPARAKAASARSTP